MVGLDEYVQLFRGSAEEIQTLFQNRLIHGTSFFRDPDSFEFLKNHLRSVISSGVSAHLSSGIAANLDYPSNAPLSIWVVGCSTGEEAYSLAMIFTELFEETGQSRRLQIRATDLNAAAIETARAGIYPKGIAHDLLPSRLRRFFVEVDGNYRVSKVLRDTCVFMRHNALVDPPYAELDLISCRNVLIYLDAAMRDALVPGLHSALKPTGLLWLGHAELLEPGDAHFALADARHKLYAKMSARSAG